MISGEKWNIKGYDGSLLKNRLYRHVNQTQNIALVFPGLAYNSTMPLLHYSIQAILASGINVLSVDYEYSSNPKFLKQSIRDRSTVA